MPPELRPRAKPRTPITVSASKSRPPKSSPVCKTPVKRSTNTTTATPATVNAISTPATGTNLDIQSSSGAPPVPVNVVTRSESYTASGGPDTTAFTRSVTITAGDSVDPFTSNGSNTNHEAPTSTRSTGTINNSEGHAGAEASGLTRSSGGPADAALIGATKVDGVSLIVTTVNQAHGSGSLDQDTTPSEYIPPTNLVQDSPDLRLEALHNRAQKRPLESSTESDVNKRPRHRSNIPLGSSAHVTVATSTNSRTDSNLATPTFAEATTADEDEETPSPSATATRQIPNDSEGRTSAATDDRHHDDAGHTSNAGNQEELDTQQAHNLIDDDEHRRRINDVLNAAPPHIVQEALRSRLPLFSLTKNIDRNMRYLRTAIERDLGSLSTTIERVLADAPKTEAFVRYLIAAGIVATGIAYRARPSVALEAIISYTGHDFITHSVIQLVWRPMQLAYRPIGDWTGDTVDNIATVAVPSMPAVAVPDRPFPPLRADIVDEQIRARVRNLANIGGMA